MSRDPRLTGAELIGAPAKRGFQVARIRGSHYCLRHIDGRNTVVPVHGSETIGPRLLMRILRDCQMTIDQLREIS